MARNVKAPLAASVACVVALVLLTLLAYGVDSVQSFDARLLAKAQAPWRSPTEMTANAIARLADPVPLLLMLIGACTIALRGGRRLDAVGAVTIVLGANLTTQILKLTLAHPRFQPVLGDDQLGAVAFPSGHATAAASIAIAFALVSPYWLRPVAALLGAGFFLLVAAGILIAGWHYPSDVVGGALVASAWGLATLAALRWVDPGRERFERGLSPPAALPSR